MPVSASGESEARSSIARRKLVVEVDVVGEHGDEPGFVGLVGVERLLLQAGQLLLDAERARGAQTPFAVDRTSPFMLRRLHAHGALGVVEHVEAIGGERELEQRAGEARLGIEDREESSAR